MRAFVVGSGLSLNHTPLDLLKDEVTFAMNKIHLIYETTTWRPTYYCFLEAYGEGNPNDAPEKMSNRWLEYVIEQHVARGEQCLIAADYRFSIETYRNHHQSYENIEYVDRLLCTHHGCDIHSDRRPDCWHLPNICIYGGTMNAAIQIASKDYDPIYLVGCDLGFVPVTEDMAEDPNHFHPDYWTWDDHPLEDRDATLMDMHAICKKEIESRGGHIYNATVGGKLEIYERVSLEAML